MTTYNRIPIPMDKGKAVLEYGDNLCRVTLQLQGIGTDKLYKPYLLWEDSYLMLPSPLLIDKTGRCSLRCQVETKNPEKIRAVAIISTELKPAAIGYISGEYDWRKCFMMQDTSAKTDTTDQTPPKPLSTDNDKEVFKSIVCHLNDDLQELKQYVAMPENGSATILFDNREHIAPFYGCKGDWIKINLKELAQLGSLWKYLNNPLVLYACRHYHHLALGRDGDTLTLGVPWEFDPSYRLEADIQGFTDIKPVENTPPAKGAMCYLLMTLQDNV